MFFMLLSVLVVNRSRELALVSCDLIAFLYFRFQDRFSHPVSLGAVLSRENAPARIGASPPPPSTHYRVMAEQRGLNSDRVPAVDVLGGIMTDQDNHLMVKSNKHRTNSRVAIFVQEWTGESARIEFVQEAIG